MLVRDKVAVITGIGPGMGREIALLFARNGASLAIGARNAARLAEVAGEIEALGRPVLHRPTDLTSRDSCRALVHTALERFGRVDVLIQNGDVLWVDRAPLVYIYGEVQRPGPMRLERGMTLMQVLAAGGGLTQRGTERGIRVHRKAADGKVQVIQAPMDAGLKDGDVVYVKESLF